LAIENHAWLVVEPPFGFGELAFSNGVKVDVLREVFSDKAIDILHRTALPGTMLIAKIDGDLGGRWRRRHAGPSRVRCHR
jgi:hypothetical protein